MMTFELLQSNSTALNANRLVSSIKRTGFATLFAALLTASAHADDIDVYTAQIAANQKPNILFVLDYSGSMNRNIRGGRANRNNPAKIDILKEAMAQVLDSNVDRINAGIGSLYSFSTTGIRWPVSELNADANSVDAGIPAGKFTVRDIIEKQVRERNAGGMTGTVDALVEAAQYFRGDSVTHNDSPLAPANRHQPQDWDIRKEQYRGGDANAAIASSYSPSNAYNLNRDGTYFCNDFSVSGGPDYCEDKLTTNCVVRTPDDKTTTGFERLENMWGNYRRCEYSSNLAWTGARYNSPITKTCQANAIVLISDGQPTVINDGESLRSVAGTGVNGCEDLSLTIFNQAPGTKTDGNCGPEVLRSLSGRDQNADITGSHVTTYTVGFNIDGAGQDYLTLLAKAGKGKFFKADEPEELNTALSKIVDEIRGGSESFASLSIDIDKANFSHDNRAFYSLFSPSIRRGWNGNLKGYFVERRGLVDINGALATVVTEKGTQFSDDAQSFWSANSDGNKVTDGGASAQLLAGRRNLLTFTGNVIPTTGAQLTRSDNHKLIRSNTAISHAMMGLPSGSAKRETALDWIQNAPMGDPLHSKSVSVNYGARQVVYIMTNQGLVHAIDATTPTDPDASDNSGGEELFAFMPQRLLKNLSALETNANTGSHIYGMDGSITRWHADDNNDGIVNNGEKMLLIMGMRRGGNAYIALDVSNPTAPVLRWTLDDTNPLFPELAQSWSRMSLISVNDRGATRRVMVFGAGYDASVQDNTTAPTASSGNAIYMVDINGNFVWSATSQDHGSMIYSIPSDLTVIDTDSDSMADRLYVGDVGGQLWRIDFEDISRSPDVTLFANLDDGHQPFFYPPSVAMNNDISGKYLSVSIGSGNRTDPLLADTQNYLYMIKDTDLAKGAPQTRFSSTLSDDLYDATANTIGSTDRAKASVAQSDLDSARGWKIALSPNEKALSALVTFEGKLLATTFEAQLPTDKNICGFETLGKYYQMEVGNAKPVTSLINESETATSDSLIARYTTLSSSGIPSAPVVIFPKGSAFAQVVVDKETVNLINQPIKQVFWHAK